MASRYAMRDAEEAERALREVQQASEGNRYCADCSTPNPEFLNLTIGTFVCTTCAEIHASHSNRRIKDMFCRELTPDDVRRMREVGNDVANRKFLARWSPQEFPEPRPNDKERLREFIWLKYEGSWKRVPSQSQQSALRPQRGYQGSGGSDYDRERSIFRDQGRNRDQQRSYWSDRFAGAQPQPPLTSARQSRDDEYSRPPPPPRYQPDYRQPAPRSRFDDSVDEDYYDGDRRGPASWQYSRRPVDSSAPSKLSKATKTRSYRDEPYLETYPEEERSEDEEENSRRHPKKAVTSSKKTAGKSTSKNAKSKGKSKSNVPAESETEESEEEAPKRKSKKSAGSLKKTHRSKRKESTTEEDEVESETDDSNSDGPESRHSSPKKSSRSKKDKESGKLLKQRSKKRSHGDGHGNPFASGDDEDIGSVASKSDNRGSHSQPPAGEFDLLSDWMRTDVDGKTSQQNAPAGGSQAQPPQHPVAAPPMPPMSVYPGMMVPNAAMMVPPGMPMLPPGGLMPFSGMMGMPAPGMAPGMSPMLPTGFISGMQGMNMQSAPPPPPPAQNAMGEQHGAPPPPSTRPPP